MLAGEELQAHCPTALRIGQRKSILAFGMANFSFEALRAYVFRFLALRAYAYLSSKCKRIFQSQLIIWKF